MTTPPSPDYRDKKEIGPLRRLRKRRDARRAKFLLLPKLSGADVELSNFFLGAADTYSTGYEASRALLREIDGLSDDAAPENDSALDESTNQSQDDPGEDTDEPSGYYSQDWGRRWLTSNGGCAYIDLNHLELCISEVISAYDHVASWHAMLRIARRALRRANAKLPKGKKIVVLVNNSDGLGQAYGSHTNFALTSRAWKNLFIRRLHYLMYLASYQASSIIFTGQGKVGSENGQEHVPYQIASRADFFERLVASHTTFSRPICNSRDEALTGSSHGRDIPIRRYHCIFYDNSLNYGSCLLKVGVMQMILAGQIEMERINPGLILEDPVHATIAFSHDPDLRIRMRTADGSKYTAVEHQLLISEELRAPVEEGLLNNVIPHVAKIYDLYRDTLEKLHAGDLDSLKGRLDWVLKRHILEQTVSENAELTFESPQIKHLDHLYSSLDPEEGLFWAYDDAGIVEKHVTDDHIRRLTNEPPDNTRAWLRAMLLRKAKPEEIRRVNWDEISFYKGAKRFWSDSVDIDLSNPLESTKAQYGKVMDSSASLEDALANLEAHANRKRNTSKSKPKSDMAADAAGPQA